MNNTKKFCKTAVSLLLAVSFVLLASACQAIKIFPDKELQSDIDKAAKDNQTKRDDVLYVKNELGEASFTFREDTRTALEKYSALSKYKPTEQDINAAASFGEDYAQEFEDGYYGGPIESGDINGEVALSFYKIELKYMEIWNFSDKIISEFLILGKISNKTSLEQAREILGDSVKENQVYKDTEYVFEREVDGQDLRITLTYPSDGSQINRVIVSKI